MNWLNNLKVRSRLMLLMLVVLSGFTVLEVVDYRSLKQSEEAEVTHEKNAEFRYLTLKLSEKLLEAQKAEKEFLFNKDINSVALFDAAIAEILETLEEMEEAESGIGGELEAALEEEEGTEEQGTDEVIGELIKDYQNAFKETVSAYEDLGLDENSGLQGEFRNAVHDVEELLEKDRQIELTASMLKMRRHEKDFILREDMKYVDRMAAEQQEFARILADSKLSATRKQELTDMMSLYHQVYLQLVELTNTISADIEKDQLALSAFQPEFDTLNALVEEKVKIDRIEITEERQLLSFQVLMVTVGVGFFIIIILTLLIRNLSSSLSRLHNTITEVGAGNYEARSNLETNDELGELGRALDTLLEERLATLAQAAKENDQLNDSIIDLLEAVSDLSDRDLTVKVPVAEDVTGPVADAINMLASETSGVLKDIQQISEKVEQAASIVSNQGQRVTQVANNERLIVQATIGKLDQASKTMNQVASLARSCNQIAVRASESTSQALESVTNTADGMNDIRETISQTEKRIKRLGERSQEITGIVAIINNIAERTHVLALNASMQAAAAGEAGRGFAVVADEVQRLAESSRQSTSEIQALVSNIQTETAETMAVMNEAISLVVNGSKLAQRSGKQMQTTQETTRELAKSVKIIAQHSILQAKTTKEVREQAASIVSSTEETSQELEQQTLQTVSLVDFSKRLLESVRVFKLQA